MQCMVDQGAVLVDDDNDGDLSIDHNKRIRPTMRAIMAAHMVNLLSTKEVQELSGPNPKALCFPDDYRMQQGYTSLHERVKKMLEEDPTLWVNKQGIPSVPTRRACREAAQRWGKRFLQQNSLADLPAHPVGWRNTPERTSLLKQMVVALQEGWVVNQKAIDAQEEAAAAALEQGLPPPAKPIEEQTAVFADLQHAISISPYIRLLRDAIVETKLTSLDGLRRALAQVSKDMGYPMFIGDQNHKKARNFKLTQVRAHVAFVARTSSSAC